MRKRLEGRRADVLGKLGVLAGDVVSRLHPLGGHAWPASMLGRMRIVVRKRGRLLATDGLSDPFDPALHASLPIEPLGYELCLDVIDRDPNVTSDAAFAESVYPRMLYALADWLVAERVDLPSLLARFRAVTVTAVAPAGTPAALVGADGLVGFLVGLPLVGASIDAHVYVAGHYDGVPGVPDDLPLGYFPVKPLTTDELAWAKSRGNTGAVELAERFLARRDMHYVWESRPSVLTEPTLR